MYARVVKNARLGKDYGGRAQKCKTHRAFNGCLARDGNRFSERYLKRIYCKYIPQVLEIPYVYAPPAHGNS